MIVARSIPALALAAFSGLCAAQPQPRWTLFAPLNSNNTYLMELSGAVAHQWPSAYRPGDSVYLLDEGTLLRTCNDTSTTGYNSGGRGGRIQTIDWNGNVLWNYPIEDADKHQHHDVRRLPNGNYIAIVWERKTVAQAVAAGRNPSTITAGELWSEMLLEIQPVGATGGNVVWQWHVWDHLVQNFDASKPNFAAPSTRPERININYLGAGPGADWLHCNGLDYNESLDQIVVSSHNNCEVWIISHAPGAPGDLLYRWGNPAACGLGTAANQKFFGQHNPQWIAAGLSGAGELLVFNNGLNRPAGAYSSIEQFHPPLAGDGTYTRAAGQAWGPASTVWTCDTASGARFYSNNISGCQRLANGDTLICVGASGDFIEVNPASQVQWQYHNTIGAGSTSVFRATRIEDRDSRLQGLLWCVSDIDDGSGSGTPDGGVTIDDLLYYLAIFSAGDVAADVDDGSGQGAPDGGVTIDDLLYFLTRFAAGC